MLDGKVWTKDFEKEIYEHWKNSNAYKFNPKSKKKVFSIDTPPPYVNTPVHIGQATTYVLMDMFARFRRMSGYEVLFPLGLDRNGLPIEMAAEKQFNVKLTALSREKALDLCRQVLESATLASIESFLRLGISFNSWQMGKNIGDMYETDSNDYRILTQNTFIDLWNRGLIYEDERINNWCPGCQTTIADAEIEYEELPTMFNDIVFKVKDSKEELIVSTTRPELVCTCAMVVFNPEDKRYNHLKGKKAITPIFNKEVPIQTHPIADPTKGTGLVMMCSAGDLSDIRFFREMNLPIIIAINKDGTMNENAGFLKGLSVADAREKMIRRLKKEKLLVRQTKIMHRTPICERSKDPIEFISMKELYLKQLEFKEDMKKLVDEIDFFAHSSKQILLDWIDSISIDWPISRRRFYATEIPLWYCEKCKKPFVPPKGKYYKPWKESPPTKKCECDSTKFIGETRVFDTWFDSSNSPLYILKYSTNPEFFKKNIPCTLRPQGKEIIRTWLYYTLLKCWLLTGKCIFKDAWINYHIVDEKGYKMSKSKGNVINPEDILNNFGAEPFRLWAAIEGNLTETDFKCSFERIEGAAKTLTKLWNVARFISSFPHSDAKAQLTELDKWILQELNELVKLCNENYPKYNFHLPATAIKHFIWETFASHYLELVKNRAYNETGKFSKQAQAAALQTLNNCLDTILKLLAPILPFITHKIYKDMRKKEIHKEEFPKPAKEEKVSFKTEKLIELNSKIWKAKKDNGMSLKDEMPHLVVPKEFKSIEHDLIIAHNIKKLTYGKEIIIEF